MDKKTLNNEIVSMRSDANRAKVHVISKLNREIKQLRVVKDFHSETQKQKNLQKAERLVKEVLHIKKVKHDDISKFALRHTKGDLTTMLATPSTSSEYRCLCRLGLHKSLLTRVEKFHTQFPVATLASLITSIGVKVKRRKVLAENVGLLKVTKTNEDSDNEALKSDSDDYDKEEFEAGHVSSDVQEKLNSGQDDDSDKTLSEEESDYEQSEVDSCGDRDTREEIKTNYIDKSKLKSSLIKKSESKSCDDNKEVYDIDKKRSRSSKRSKSKSKIKKVQTKNYVHNTVKNEGNMDDNESSLHTQQKKRKKLKKVKEVEESSISIEQKISDKVNVSKHKPKDFKRKAVSNRSNEMKVMKFSQLLETDTPPCEPLQESNDEPSSAVATKAIDSFFVGRDGKSAFLSTVTLKEPTIEKATNRVSQPVYDHLGRRLNRREIRARLHGKKSFKKPTSGFFNNSYNSKKWVDSNTTPAFMKDNYSDIKGNVLPPPPEEKLHPSWEAKKKQKEQSSTVFQGKKIKFDD